MGGKNVFFSRIFTFIPNKDKNTFFLQYFLHVFFFIFFHLPVYLVEFVHQISHIQYIKKLCLDENVWNFFYTISKENNKKNILPRIPRSQLHQNNILVPSSNFTSQSSSVSILAQYQFWQLSPILPNSLIDQF